MTVLKNIVAFAALAPGVPTTLPHGLFDAEGRGLIPDTTVPDAAPVTITAADDTNITVRNDSAAILSVNVLCEYWHTIPRALPSSVINLTPRPFIPAGSGAAMAVSPERTIIVALANGDATTIAGGIAAAAALVPAPTPANPATIQVYPGVYNEAPFTVIAGVSLIGVGSAETTRIVATVATSPLMTIAVAGEAVGLSLAGANGVGGIGVLASAAGIAEGTHLIVNDCTVAFRATGVGTHLRLWQSTATRGAGEAMTTAYEAVVGGKLIANTTVIAGTVATRIATGYLCDGAGSVMCVTGFKTDWADNAVLSTNGGNLQIWAGLLENYVNGLQTDNGSEIHSFAVELAGLGTLDLLVNNAGDTFHGNGNAIRNDKISIIAGANVTSSALTRTPGDQGHSFLGELTVGRPGAPAEAVFGEGDSHVRGLAVFRNTNFEIGAWTDITAEMSSAVGSTATAFSGIVAGNTLYIGSDHEFPNNKINATIAIVLGVGSLIWEYWNGAAWVARDVMACDSAIPYASHATDVFGRVANEQVRYSPTIGWATKLLNGSTKYWLRVRVAVGITTSPTLQQIKIGTNRTEINGDGVVEHYGTGELLRDLVWHQRLVYDLVGSASGNNNVAVSANISLVLKDNQFANGANDGVGGVVEIPEGLDTSRPLTLVFAWIPKATGGDVEFESRLAPVLIGDTLDGTLVDTLQSQVVTAPAIDVLVRDMFDYDVSSLEPGDFIGFSLFRDATGGNPDDTLAGNINIVQMAVSGTFWR